MNSTKNEGLVFRGLPSTFFITVKSSRQDPGRTKTKANDEEFLYLLNTTLNCVVGQATNNNMGKTGLHCTLFFNLIRNSTMKKEYFRYMGLIFLIMGLTGIISETGPVWARYILLSSGILILLFTFFKRSR